ncbi:hypothetical protein LVO79_07005 [Roseivivax marinus]|uniref:hypothetical protein n=1 Tax=Roseivivax marinus TaxID=1379903 RepID=UPI001F041E8D|nr:hypothetical protein [Roseivivax marinus]UMA66186.1 hypothetical protein LVO79_07005 [Roseivivax marinus]
MATFTLRGLHGLYRFNWHWIPYLPPAIPGVYMLIRADAKGLNALYVGESDDLECRLWTDASHHDGMKRAYRFGFNAIAVMSAPSHTLIPIETDLRDMLNPPCNLQGKGILAD